MATPNTMSAAREEWRTQWCRRLVWGFLASGVAGAGVVLWLCYAPRAGGAEMRVSSWIGRTLSTMFFMPHRTGDALRMACGLVVGVVAVVAMARPLWGLCMLACAAPVLSGIPLGITGGATYPLVLFAGLAFLAAWLARQAVDGAPFDLTRRQWLLVVSAGVCMVSGVASLVRYSPPNIWGDALCAGQAINHAGYTREMAGRFVAFVMANAMLFAGVACATRSIVCTGHGGAARAHRTRYVLMAACGGGVATAVVALCQSWHDVRFLANSAYYWTELSRVNGMCSDPNALGSCTALCMAPLVALAVWSGAAWPRMPWRRRLCAGAGAAVCIVSIGYSGSRSALMAALLAVVAVGGGTACRAMLRLAERVGVPVRLRWWVASASVAALLVLAVVGVPPTMDVLDRHVTVAPGSAPLMHRMKRSWQAFRREGSVWGMVGDRRRMAYWQYALDMVRDYPVSGVGLGAYVIEMPNYAAEAGQTQMRPDNACNYYLHGLAELGVTGATPLLLFLGATLWAGIAAWRGTGRWSHTLRPQRGALVLTLAVFLATLVFGMHTMADEVAVLFAILVGLVGATTVDGTAVPVRAGWAKWMPRLALMALVAMQVVGIWWTSHGPLRGEQRLAACGMACEGGWYSWEQWPNVPFPVRWMGRTAYMTVPRGSIGLGIPVVSSDPSVTGCPQKVTFYLNGREAKTHEIAAPGEWALVRLMVPYADAFGKADAPHVSVRIEVARTWTPATAGSSDARQLGIAVGEARWLDPEVPEGGWYPQEYHALRPFRWSRAHAWTTVVVGPQRTLDVPLYALHPLQGVLPQRVAVFFDGHRVDVVTPRRAQWENHVYTLPPSVAAGQTGMVEIVVSRTWSPRHFGRADKRELGVAVGTVTSR